MAERLSVVVPGFLREGQKTSTNEELADRENKLLFLEGKTPHQQNLLQATQDEIKKRGLLNQQQQQAANEAQVAQLLKGGAETGGGDVGVPNIGTIEAEERGRTDAQRKALEQIFGARQADGIQGIEQQFAPIRSKQIAEEAALGRLRSPISIPTISKIDEQKAQAISNLIRGFGAERGRAEVGLESELAERLRRAREFGVETGLRGREQGFRERASLADILQRGQQFDQTFGLQKEQFREQGRQFDIGQTGAEEERRLARQLGEAQAEASRPSGLSEITGILGGIGQVAGGIGSFYTGNPIGGVSGILGGVGTLAGQVEKKKKKPVEYQYGR